MTKKLGSSAGAKTSATTASPKTTRPKSGTQAAKTARGAAAKPTTPKSAATKGSKVAVGEKKKKKAAEEEAKPTTTPAATATVEIEVTISEDKKEGDEGPTEIPSSSSVDATPLVDIAFTPSTENKVEQIISSEASLSEELAESLPRLSEALGGSAVDEEDKTKEAEAQPWLLEGTSVDKVVAEEESEGTRELEPPGDVGAEGEETQPKDNDDERAERRKVGSVFFFLQWYS